MSKSQRRPQQIFSIVMWILLLVFAAFLMGLGGLIIKDLPQVDRAVTVEQFADIAALESADAQVELKASQLLAMRRSIEDAQQNLMSAQADYQSARASFDAWIATRTATQSNAQNPEVIARSRGVEELKTAERSAQRAVAEAQSELRQAERVAADARADRDDIIQAARPKYRAALRAQELRIFLLRLALTLPLLLLAGWIIMKNARAPIGRSIAGFRFLPSLLFSWNWCLTCRHMGDMCAMRSGLFWS